MVDHGRRTDGRRIRDGHPKSSPCEPNGSGELKRDKNISHYDSSVKMSVSFDPRREKTSGSLILRSAMKKKMSHKGLEKKKYAIQSN